MIGLVEIVSHSPQEEKLLAMTKADSVDVSVVIYVDEHLENAAQMYAHVANVLRGLQKSFEFIFVDDGSHRRIFTELEGLQQFFKSTKVIRLPRFYGSSTAMSLGFRHARGRLILTLGSFLQVHPEEITKMFEKIAQGSDFVNGWRVQRTDSSLNQLHTKIYNWMISQASHVKLHDANCTLKLFKREVAEELPLYGDFYRFLPILAARQGFQVKEVPIAQRKEINTFGVYSPGTYLRRLLDLLALLYIGRFSRKPLRFFGIIGAMLFLTGFFINLYLTYVKLALHEPIAGRPLLLLGTVLLVLGVQTASIGLIGELVLFTHAKHLKSYHVETILE